MVLAGIKFACGPSTSLEQPPLPHKKKGLVTFACQHWNVIKQ